ncbi:MAG: hypothetical protein K6D38_00165 [Pseudobutyrivibrio sp.]|nr:hypothetical protein [Pseudobutyrivibrio sp.]
MDNQNVQPVYTNDEMTVGQWLVTLLIGIIPFVNIVMLIVWACGNPVEKRARKNWAIAQLIMMAIILVLYFAVFASIISSVMHGSGMYY